MESSQLDMTVDSQDEQSESWQDVELFIQEDSDEVPGLFRRLRPDGISLSQSFTQGFSPSLPRSVSHGECGPGVTGCH